MWSCVLDGFCRVGSINSSMGLALFGEMRDDGTMHVRDSSFAFKFGSSYSEVCLFWAKFHNKSFVFYPLKCTIIIGIDSEIKNKYMYFQVYIGQDSVRGIVVDHWKSCMKWAQSNRTYTVDYYFSGMGECTYKVFLYITFLYISTLCIVYCVTVQ